MSTFDVHSMREGDTWRRVTLTADGGTRQKSSKPVNKFRRLADIRGQ